MRKRGYNSANGLRILWLTMLCGFVAVIVLLIVLLSMGKEPGTTTEVIKYRDSQSDSTDTPKDDGDTLDQSSLAEQKVDITFTILDGESIETTVNLGEFASAVTSRSVIRDQEVEAEVSFEDGAVTIKLCRSSEEYMDLLTPELGIEGDFCGEDTSVNYCWEWHFGDGQWTEIPQEAVILNEGVLGYDLETVKTFCQEGAPVLRVVMTGENADGGSLRVELNGISIISDEELSPAE